MFSTHFPQSDGNIFYRGENNPDNARHWTVPPRNVLWSHSLSSLANHHEKNWHKKVTTNTQDLSEDLLIHGTLERKTKKKKGKNISLEFNLLVRTGSPRRFSYPLKTRKKQKDFLTVDTFLWSSALQYTQDLPEDFFIPSQCPFTTWKVHTKLV